MDDCVQHRGAVQAKGIITSQWGGWHVYVLSETLGSDGLHVNKEIGFSR